MERTMRNKTNWLRKFAWHRRDSADNISLDHGLYPESYFREKLVEERMRAERSKKAMVLMIIDAEHIGTEGIEDLADSLGAGVNGCVRDTDICGRLREGGLIGVILTEIPPEKLEAAQHTVARKTREKLAALLSQELAEQIGITFHVLNPSEGNPLFDLSFSTEKLRRAPAPGGERLTMASLQEGEGEVPEGFQDGARSG